MRTCCILIKDTVVKEKRKWRFFLFKEPLSQSGLSASLETGVQQSPAAVDGGGPWTGCLFPVLGKRQDSHGADGSSIHHLTASGPWDQRGGQTLDVGRLPPSLLPPHEGQHHTHLQEGACLTPHCRRDPTHDPRAWESSRPL